MPRARYADRYALAASPDAPEWMAGAACLEPDVDPELFYQHPTDRSGLRTAKKMCRPCPVRDDCLAYALDIDDRYGVWGGQAPHERARLRNGGGA